MHDRAVCPAWWSVLLLLGGRCKSAYPIFGSTIWFNGPVGLLLGWATQRISESAEAWSNWRAVGSPS